MAMTFADSILKPDTLYSGHSSTYNIVYGAQGGFMGRIGMVANDGKAYGEWIANQPYIKRNIIPIVIQAPRFFDFMPDPQGMIAAYKSLMEAQPLTIDGLQSGITVEFDETPVGNAGEMQQEPTKVNRARTELTFTFKEKAGRPIQKFLDTYIRWGIADPDTNVPLITTLFKSIDDFNGLYTPDFFSGTMLFIEPDITHRVVVDAWLCTNMIPMSAGERTGKMDRRSPGEPLEHSIQFTSITMNTEAVLRFADIVLGNITVISKIPDLDMILPVSDIDPKVQAASNAGFNVASAKG